MRTMKLGWCSLAAVACCAAAAMAQEPRPTPAPPQPASAAAEAAAADAVSVPEPRPLPQMVAKRPAAIDPAAPQPAIAGEPAVSATRRAPCEDNGSARGTCRRCECPLGNRIKAGFRKLFATDCAEMPFGAAVNAHLCAQIANGVAARMVLYQYDFCDPAACDAFQLNPHGCKRLKDIARMVQCSGFHPLLIERTLGNPKLDVARREYVLKLLAESGVDVPEQLVVVGEPETPGLSGEEAILIQRNLRSQTKAGTSSSSAAGGRTPQNLPGGSSIETTTFGTSSKVTLPPD